MSKFNARRLEQLVPYVWGEQTQQPDVIKLNTNENPYPPTPRVQQKLEQFTIADLQKYPDPTGAKLKAEIGKKTGLKSENIFLGNGSDDILSHLFLAFYSEKTQVLVPNISYGLYPVLADLYDIYLTQIPLNADFSLNLAPFLTNSAPILIANPNAPTGLCLTQEDVLLILSANLDQLVVLDEAYVDFADASMAHLVNLYDNLLIVQTSSKSRSLAGLRLGWALGCNELIKDLEAVRDCINPYNVDAIAYAIGEASFQDDTYFCEKKAEIIQTREQFFTSLEQLGFWFLRSKTNFVMVKHPRLGSDYLFEKLAEHKILVRYFDLKEYGQFIRISIGLPEQMATVAEVLSQIISKKGVSL
ncbi:MAG: histidinol-phosphate transaminase [Culicoidibacterales bacterium]